MGASETGGRRTSLGSKKLRGKCVWFDSKKGVGSIFIISDKWCDDLFVSVDKSQLFCRNPYVPSLASGEPLVFEVRRGSDDLWKAVNVTGPNGHYCIGSDPFALPEFGHLTDSTELPKLDFEKGSAESGAVVSRLPLCSVPHLFKVVILYCDYGTRMNISQISELTSAVTNMCVSDARNALGSLPFAVSRPPKVPTIRCGNEQLPKIVEETSHEFIAILPQCFLYFGKAKKQWVVAKHCTEGVHSAVFGWKPPAKKNSQRPIRDPISEKPTVKLSTLWQATAGDSSDWKVNSMANCGETIAVGTAECLALLNAQTGAVVTKSLGNHIPPTGFGKVRKERPYLLQI